MAGWCPQRVRCHMPPKEFPTNKFDLLLDHFIPYLFLFLLVTGLGDNAQGVKYASNTLWQTDVLLCQACMEQLFSNILAIHNLGTAN